jgi:hypothetical protein
MSILKISAVALVLCGATIQFASAQAAPSQRTGELAHAKKRFAERAQTSKGADRMLAERHQRHVDRMIKDLEAGRPVDPSAIDEAIRRAERGW